MAGSWIEELTGAALSSIPDKIVVVAKKSLSTTISGGSHALRTNALPIKLDKPEWGIISPVQGSIYRFRYLI